MVVLALQDWTERETWSFSTASVFQVRSTFSGGVLVGGFPIIRLALGSVAGSVRFEVLDSPVAAQSLDVFLHAKVHVHSSISLP